MNPTVLILGIFGILVVVNKIFGKSEEEKEKEKEEKEQMEEEAADIKEELAAGIQPTWKPYKYKEYADSLYSALNGAGTNELAVSKVFEHIINDIDYKMLNNAFGYRDGDNMTTWLRDDLSQDWIAQINGMLARNGVTFRI